MIVCVNLEVLQLELQLSKLLIEIVDTSKGLSQ